MANLARFLIGTSPSNDGGYDVNPGDTPALRLEASSSLVYRVTFEVHSAAAGAPRATSDAPTLVLSNGATTGQSVDAATPASAVTISSGIPAVRAPHLWEVRCLVNGGVNPDGSVNPDCVFSRFIAMRSAFGFRKIIPAERGEYDPVDAWAGAINELVAAGAFAATIPVNGIPSTSIATGTDFPISTANGIATLDPNRLIAVAKWHRPLFSVAPSVIASDASQQATIVVGGNDLSPLVLANAKTYAAIVSSRILIKKTSTPSTYAFVDVVSTLTIIVDQWGSVNFATDATAASVSVIGAAELARASASVTCVTVWGFQVNIRRPPGVECTFVSADTAIIELKEVA